MKKIVLLVGVAVLLVPLFSYAQDCPAGQAPIASQGPNNTLVYTCAPTGNTATQGGIVPNGQGTNLKYTPLEPIPGINSGANGQALNFPTLLGNIYKIAIIIGALFSVLMLTLSGIRYMVSDIVTSKERAKKRITASLYGLVLIAASYLILNTINPQLVTFTLSPGTVSIPQNTQTNSGGAGGSASSNLTQYRDPTSCGSGGGVWMFDSATCIPPLSRSLSDVGSDAYKYLTTQGIDTRAACDTAGGAWTPSTLLGSLSSYCKLP